MFSYFFSLPKKNNENKSLSIDEFVVLNENKDNSANISSDNSANISSKENLIDSVKNDGVMIFARQNLSASIFEDYQSGFTIVSEYRFRTANTKPLDELCNFVALNPDSAHKVYKATEKISGAAFFVKEVEHDMAYIEAFMGQLYEMSLLYGFTRAFVRVDDINPSQLKTSSKAITDFKTFKDGNLTAELLDNGENRRRFIEFSSVVIRMKEDDFHRGNLTMPNKSSPGFQGFDADCAYGDVTWEIKGLAAGDGFTYPLRNPSTAFEITEEMILHSPNLPNHHYNPRYFPSRTNPIREQVGPYLNLPNNPWKFDETQVVQALEKDPDTLHIYFETFVDWMIDISIRFPHVAALNIPSDLKVKQTDKNVIDLYVDSNKKTDEQYFSVLPKLSAFQQFLETQTESLLKHILIRAMIRNARFIKEKEEMIYAAEEKSRFTKQFDSALHQPEAIIERYNSLIAKVNGARIDSIPDHISFCSYDFAKVKPIDSSKAIALINEAKEIANQMITLENDVGIENWQLFEKFDYKYTPTVQLQPTKLKGMNF